MTLNSDNTQGSAERRPLRRYRPPVVRAFQLARRLLLGWWNGPFVVKLLGAFIAVGLTGTLVEFVPPVTARFLPGVYYLFPIAPPPSLPAPPASGSRCR